MVKVGFICEGQTEKLLIESGDFQEILRENSIECVRPVIDAKGRDELLPHRILQHRTTLQDRGVERIVILTDLDENLCVTETQNRVKALNEEMVIVSVKQIEAWFLADSKAMSGLLRRKFNFQFPETEIVPYETVRSLVMQATNQGIGGKLKLVRKMLDLGFSLRHAAAHPACPSARYFLQKLTELQSNPA